MLISLMAMMAAIVIARPHRKDIIYTDAVLLTSLQAVDHCVEYEDDKQSKCKKCEDAYYVDQGNCDRCMAKCNRCDEPSKCLECENGYYFSGTNTNCTKCPTPCKRCYGRYTCLECKEDYFLAVRSCVTDKVILLYYFGLSTLIISSILAIVCCCRLVFTIEKVQQYDVNNLFHSDAD